MAMSQIFVKRLENALLRARAASGSAQSDFPVKIRHPAPSVRKSDFHGGFAQRFAVQAETQKQ